MKYYFKENFHFLYGDGQLYDEEGNVAYTFQQKTVMFPEVHLYRDDVDLGFVATEFKILYREYTLWMNGEKKETINSMLTLFRTHLFLTNSHWSINGSFMSLRYNIKNRKGDIVAIIDQEPFKAAPCYYIDILDEENEVFILLIVLIINLYNKASSNAAVPPPMP